MQDDRVKGIRAVPEDLRKNVYIPEKVAKVLNRRV
jgi:hypothetical protein